MTLAARQAAEHISLAANADMPKPQPSRAAAGDRPKNRTVTPEAEAPPPFPAHLPDPPRKNPVFLLIAVGLLLAWLLALIVMSIVA